MRKSHLPRVARKKPTIDPALFFFSLAFLLGAAGGYGSCKAAGISTEIQEYLTQYAQVLASGGVLTSASLLYVAAAYYRMPCVIFLCSIFRRAFYLACGVFLLEGFLLSFAVANFTLAMGRTGALVSLCVFGVRALFILPVSLSVILRRLHAGGNERRGRRSTTRQAKLLNRGNRVLLFYPVILALGVMAELTFVPKLVALALEQIS